MSKIEGLVPTILVMNDAWFLPYVLESLRGRFERYVIYDVGSEDGTTDIIDWFTGSEDAEFFVRQLPFCIPKVQGAYRNSMMMEARSEWTFMVDGDEIYSQEGLDTLEKEFIAKFPPFHDSTNLSPLKRYGVVQRTELDRGLMHKYSETRTHHRLYQRTALFHGNHPGEVPFYNQKPRNEIVIDDVMCYHFHNALRSPLDTSVPKRVDRKSQGTYHPGELEPFDLLNTLPILKKPIEAFQVSPDLEKLQNAFNSV
ncbi:hypothetical protein LCGC14_1884200 [marine sediment metagenome]|uniref:Glycosyltransferase 2-like domain-containing protein n=1 Tax=marine sediment metagenome TaxID=412755 RepID=A0A0F9G1B5_9ZZZZ